MNFIEIFIILFLHWVSDFVLQTDNIARNKSKSNKILLTHISCYILLFIPFAFYFLTPINAIIFIIINLILHFIIDYCTSRRTSYLSSINKYGSTTVPNFGMFSIIGLDQFLHYISLFGTYMLLKGIPLL